MRRRRRERRGRGCAPSGAPKWSQCSIERLNAGHRLSQTRILRHLHQRTKFNRNNRLKLSTTIP